MALQKLSTLGLVEIRVGEGTFVREQLFAHLMGEVSAVVAHQSLTPYVTELRKTIETAAVSAAVERADDNELDQFVALAGALVRLSRSGETDRYIDADYEFHLALCKLAHNPLFEMVYSSIQDLFKLSILKNLDRTAAVYVAALEASATHHVKLAQALRERDGAAASQLVCDIAEARDEVTDLEHAAATH